MKLAKAIERILEGADRDKTLKQWEEDVLDYAKSMQRHGVNIGNRSQFGTHPLRG
jgi:hypothetical protein